MVGLWKVSRFVLNTESQVLFIIQSCFYPVLVFLSTKTSTNSAAVKQIYNTSSKMIGKDTTSGSWYNQTIFRWMIYYIQINLRANYPPLTTLTQTSFVSLQRTFLVYRATFLYRAVPSSKQKNNNSTSSVGARVTIRYEDQSAAWTTPASKFSCLVICGAKASPKNCGRCCFFSFI